LIKTYSNNLDRRRLTWIGQDQPHSPCSVTFRSSSNTDNRPYSRLNPTPGSGIIWASDPSPD